MDSRHQRGGRTGVGMFAGFLTGFLWFFLSFAAMFNGVFVLLLFLPPVYALSGALLVWLFRLPPIHAAFSLVGSALPWVAWLKSLVWPALLMTAFGMSLLGAHLVAARRRRKPSQADPTPA